MPGLVKSLVRPSGPPGSEAGGLEGKIQLPENPGQAVNNRHMAFEPFAGVFSGKKLDARLPKK